MGVSSLPIEEQASTSDSGKGEGTGEGTEDTYAAPSAGGLSLFFLPCRRRGKHARAPTRRYLAGDEYDNGTRDGESGRLREGERAGRAGEGRERGGRGARTGSAEESARTREGRRGAAGRAGAERRRGARRRGAGAAGPAELCCAAALSRPRGRVAPERSLGCGLRSTARFTLRHS